MQDEKSQLQNKAKALRVLRARIYEAERERQQAELSATRRSQIGSGERAEKIRTYNYPDSRVTDHRVKVTLNLEKVLPGGLDDFTEALQAEDRRRALEERCLPRSASVTCSAGHGAPRQDLRDGAPRRRAPARAHARRLRIELYTDFDRPLSSQELDAYREARRPPRAARAGGVYPR